MDISQLGRFHIAAGYDPSLPDTWIWEDRSADVNHPEGGGTAVQITGGRANEVTQIEAGSCLFEVDNVGGHYCSDNPNGRWYGLIDLGCPARWGTISGAEAWTANTTNGWGTPDVGTSWALGGSASDWSSSGGVGLLSEPTVNLLRSAVLVGADARNGEATFVASVPALATGASLVVGLLARRPTTGPQVWFCIDFGLAGVLGARIKRNTGGTSTDLAGSPSAGTYSANQRIKARCQWDGQDLRMRVWPEASAEPTTWTALATDNQCIGSAVGLQTWRVASNTNTSPVVFTLDNLEVEAVEIVGTLTDLPVRWDPTATVSWAPLEIAGITRLLSQGADLVESPIHRQLIAQPVAAYWPLEDGEGTAIAASAVARGVPAGITGGQLGSTDCPAGALSALTLTTAGTSHVTGAVTTWPVPLDGYAGMCYFKLPTTPAATQQRLMELTGTGTIARWVIYISSTQFTVEGYLADGTLSLAPAGTLYTINPLDWTAIQFEAQEVGGNVNWSLLVYQVGSPIFASQGTGTFAGTADRLTAGSLYAPVDGTLVSHFWLGDDLLQFLTISFMLISAAYPGELDTDRMIRLARERGVRMAVEAGAGEPLGPQKIAGFLDVVRDAEAAGMGVLYETGAGYGYRPRVARYNRPTTATLAIAAAGDIAEEPQPTKDDQFTRNLWTVVRDGGSSATFSDPVHIARRFRRPDTTTVNIATDGRLPDYAAWLVHLGTWGEYRWPQLVVDFTDRPALLTAWRGRPFAPRITVTGVPAQGPVGADLDLIVEGFLQEITSASWRVTLNCSPAKLWEVGVYDDATKRYDSASTTLGSGVNTTAISLTFSTASSGDLWDTTATPYDVLISGERITVTVMGAASGTGPYTQTATVTRSVNGIVKALPAGAEIHVATPGRYAL